MNLQQLKQFQANARKHAEKLLQRAAAEQAARDSHVKQEMKNGARTTEAH